MRLQEKVYGGLSRDSSEVGPASTNGSSQHDRVLTAEIQKRRTFAIISHPDAGKTTLTEKFLLYAGQINEAGAVRGRKTQRAVTSDWMQIERERGISITSTVVSFEYGGHYLNLLDTPGHDDFSEDTYRTLTAADCAIMVIDAVKGIETQTRKLFKICAESRIPILTFVNKMDRPGSDPLGVLDEIEDVLGIHAVPLNWPIGNGREFRGVYDRQRDKVLLFRHVPHGSVRVPTEEMSLHDACDRLEPHVAERLREEVELIGGAGESFDREAFLRGGMTPVFYASALNNFGVASFLEGFLKLSPPPQPRMSDRGPVPPDSSDFAGVVFKIQANLNPRHHDRVAFLRVCAGRFQRDMEIINARTGEKIRIKRSHRAFAQERETVDEAFPGDVVGLVIPGKFRLGDTLCAGERVEFSGKWHFPPECFATIRCADTARRKQFQQGLLQLREEGVVQMYFDGAMLREPVLGVVGELQFDVVQYRLESEYGARTTLMRMPHQIIRWVVGGTRDVEAMRVPTGSRKLRDDQERPVVLFETPWQVGYCTELNPQLTLLEEASQEDATTINERQRKDSK